MMWMISPAVAKTIARQQTIDEVRESRRGRATRFTPEPDSEPRRRHRVRRRSHALRSVGLRKHIAH